MIPHPNNQIYLPEPTEIEQEHSLRLCHLIIDEIAENNGQIPFRRYMEMALYEPGLGYYMAGARKFGQSGDFITAPEISSLFSDCLAQQCAQVLGQFERSACILEIGAGSGIMAANILTQLEQLDCLPDHYYILELSAELKQRQQETLQQQTPHLLGCVKWLESLENLSLHGVILGNEVLDAMPVTCFNVTEDTVHECRVQWDEERFCWLDIPADPALQQQVSSLESQYGSWSKPYQSEINLNLRAWMNTLSTTLAEGAMLLVDYGYVQSEYYHPERTQGTLISHYRHRATDDPFIYPGLQDLSTSVDFSAVAQAGVNTGLTLAGYTSQSLFLLSLGLDGFFQQKVSDKNTDPLKLAQEIKMLTLPSEMGERFQVIGFVKSIDSALQGFDMRNLIHRL